MNKVIKKQSRSENFTAPSGIFCVEGEWDKKEKMQSTVQPLLDYITKNSNWIAENIPPSIYRRAASKDQLIYLVNTFEEAKDYQFCYFATHCGRKKLYFSEDFQISLPDFLDLFTKKSKGRHIHISGCEILYPSKNLNSLIDDFKKRTGVISVSGYTKNADWFNCSALDLMYMTDFISTSVTKNPSKDLSKICPGLVEEFGFVKF